MARYWFGILRGPLVKRIMFCTVAHYTGPGRQRVMVHCDQAAKARVRSEEGWLLGHSRVTKLLPPLISAVNSLRLPALGSFVNQYQALRYWMQTIVITLASCFIRHQVLHMEMQIEKTIKSFSQLRCIWIPSMCPRMTSLAGHFLKTTLLYTFDKNIFIILGSAAHS